MITWRRTHPTTSVLLMMLVMEVSSGGILACHPAEYQAGNECCPKCPAGYRVETNCEEFRSTSCVPCEEGTFVARLSGLKDCITCSTCDSASGVTMKSSCTATSDTVCKPLDGHFCINFEEGSCEAAVKHKSCNPGQYTSQKGTDSTDSVCSDCREETFSNGTSSSQLHTECEELNPQRMKAGTVLALTENGEPGLNTGALVAVSLFAFISLGVSAGAAILLRKKAEFLSSCWRPSEKCGYTNPVEVI